MIKCKNCGIDIPDNSSFCTGCGTPVDKAQESGFGAAAPISQVLDLEKKRAEAAQRELAAAQSAAEQERKRAEAMVAEGPAKQTKPAPPAPTSLKNKKGALGSSAAPDARSPYALISPSTYMWLTLIFAIPGIGLIFACIICLSTARYKNIQNLAVGFVTMHLVVAVVFAIAYFIILAVNPLLLNQIINAARALFEAVKEGFMDTSSPFPGPGATPFATPPIS